MTQKAVAVHQPAVVSLPQQPVALPPILTEATRTEGFRNPVWVARKLLPGEKVVVERTLLELERRDVPAPVNVIRLHVGKMLNHWENGRLNSLEKQAIIADWEYHLRDFAEGHIAEACAEWVAESRFKPAPADIIALARRIQERDRESVRRARVLLGMEAPRRWEKIAAPAKATNGKQVTPGMWAALTAKLRRAPGPPSPAPSEPEEQRRSAARVLDEIAKNRNPAAVAALNEITQRTKQA